MLTESTSSAQRSERAKNRSAIPIAEHAGDGEDRPHRVEAGSAAPPAVDGRLGRRALTTDAVSARAVSFPAGATGSRSNSGGVPPNPLPSRDLRGRNGPPWPRSVARTRGPEPGGYRTAGPARRPRHRPRALARDGAPSPIGAAAGGGTNCAGAAANTSSRRASAPASPGGKEQRPALRRDQLGDAADRRADRPGCPGPGPRSPRPARGPSTPTARRGSRGRRAALPCVSRRPIRRRTRVGPAAAHLGLERAAPADHEPGAAELGPRERRRAGSRRPCRRRAGRGSRRSAAAPSPRGDRPGAPVTTSTGL